jgi:hypothetical protein
MCQQFPANIRGKQLDMYMQPEVLVAQKPKKKEKNETIASNQKIRFFTLC